MFFLYVILATGDAVAIGLALTVAIMVIGKHSGGHFNPAVSVMLSMAGKTFNERISAICCSTSFRRISRVRVIQKI